MWELDRDRASLAGEKGVQLLLLQDVNLPPALAKAVIDLYLCPFHFEILRKIEFGRIGLGGVGGELIASKLSAAALGGGAVRLMHLSLPGNNLGDTGVGKILDALCECEGGAENLLVLDVSSNNLTMVTDHLSVIGQYVNLRSLCMSHNNITLDLPSHTDTLAAGTCERDEECHT